jgi:mannose-6-phosphate isomerase class I
LIKKSDLIPNFNKTPIVEVKGAGKRLFSGQDEIVAQLKLELNAIHRGKKIIAVECYPGIHDDEVLETLAAALAPDAVIQASEAFKTEDDIREMTFKDVTEDRIFGYMTRLKVDDFFDPDKLAALRTRIGSVETGTVLLFGTGASLLYPSPDLLIYADMARWEIQLRMRRNEVSNLGIHNKEEHIEGKYKRGYFVDWRVCDRLKKRVMPRCHWILDTNKKDMPGMVRGADFFDGLKQAASRPFSVVPYFDAGPWGGQWMKETFGPGSDAVNYAWCFNCVPEENSLLLDFDGHRFETPAINLVFFKPEALLGRYVRESFGDEFPIRFDFLDTMGGGNLSLQVHPMTAYIREKFGMDYTQDESYYLVEAGEEAGVYLGLKEGVAPEAMAAALRDAEQGAAGFDAEAFVEQWPAQKHDHFLIPGGTVHCSGKDCMVLEISATPYIFTFKLWDWGRLGMDGKPRPINIEHGIRNIQWNRTTQWVSENLVNRVVQVASGDGWREESTGLHETEFIETRRHIFTKSTPHYTDGGVNVLCLVEGREVVVESPTGAFDPFVVHFAETFIVPAAAGAYTIKPCSESEGRECITVKAFVRRNS